MSKLEQKLLDDIEFIYGPENAVAIFERIQARMADFRALHPDLAASSPQERVSERDAILITYGDMIQKGGQKPLQTLTVFLQKYLADILSTVHILPFYPYSSDDGFSVIDYKKVNPDLGGWNHIQELGEHFRLMFDAVINHISAESTWFQGYLQGDPQYQDYFFEIPSDFDTSQVFRPRALPLLTPFQTSTGEKHVWTTFSADQIDLNFRSSELLLDVIDVLLQYIASDAEFIRLDAIAFIWKESGTNCIHLPQTHRLIQLMRTILDIVAPRTSLITETNVPHEENISYFGDGYNEAQMVYNFSLPPLTLHAFHTGNAQVLSKWAQTLSQPSDQTTFFNFLASHDGVGLMPARGYLSDEEIETMAKRVEALGGYVSYKNNPDGSQTAYELNINYLDALRDPQNLDEDNKKTAQRFLASQSIMLALRGVPGIYFHSLLGSRNWKAGVEQTGRYRTINREKLKYEYLEKELGDLKSLRFHVFRGFRRMLEARKRDPAFHPQGGQQILDINKMVFALLRTSVDGKAHTLCLHNVTNQNVDASINLSKLPMAKAETLFDTLSDKNYPIENAHLKLTIAPYQVLWLQMP